MQQYKYKALNEDYVITKGVVTAAGENDVEQKLKELGLELISTSVIKHGSLFGLMDNKIEKKDIMLLCIHLQELERAGVPILDSLKDIYDSTPQSRMKDILYDLYESITNGSLLSEAFARHPDVFDDVFINLISSGEKTGKLVEIFGYLVSQIKWRMDLESSVKKALTYPAVMLVVFVIMLTVMMAFVVPQVSGFLLDQGIELPIYTKILIGSSKFFANNWFFLAIFIVLSVIAFKVMKSTMKGFRYAVDGMSLKIPFFGILFRKIEIAVFCRFFAVTYSSGIEIIKCIDISASVVKNTVLQGHMCSVKESIKNGLGITESMKQTRQFPSLVLRMFKVGEDSGNLSKVLEYVNVLYDSEIKESIESMIALLKPALVVVIGLLLFWVIASVFGPIYGNFSRFG